MRPILLPFLPARPDPISTQTWQQFLERRRTLNEIRADLESMEKDWEAERDELVAMLVDGAEIEWR